MVSRGRGRGRGRKAGRVASLAPRDARVRPPSLAECLATRCGEVLDRLAKKDTLRIFAAPVDNAIAPNYDVIVTRKMDLSTVRAKLGRGEYRDLRAFHADLSLIWNNCLLYNGAEMDNVFSKKAVELRKFTDTRLMPSASHSLEHDKKMHDAWAERHRKKQPNASPGSMSTHGNGAVLPSAGGSALLGPSAAAGLAGSDAGTGGDRKSGRAGGSSMDGVGVGGDAHGGPDSVIPNVLSQEQIEAAARAHSATARRAALREQYGPSGLYRPVPNPAMEGVYYVGPDRPPFRPSSLWYKPHLQADEQRNASAAARASAGTLALGLPRGVVLAPVPAGHQRVAGEVLDSRGNPLLPGSALASFFPRRFVDLRDSLVIARLGSRPGLNPCRPMRGVLSVRVKDYVQSLRVFVAGSGVIATRIISELLSPEIAVLRDEENRKKRKRDAMAAASAEAISNGEDPVRAAEAAGVAVENEYLQRPAKVAAAAPRRALRPGDVAAGIPVLPKLSKRIDELDGIEGLERIVGPEITNEVRAVPLGDIDFSMPYGLNPRDMAEIAKLATLPRAGYPDLSFLLQLKTATDQHARRLSVSQASFEHRAPLQPHADLGQRLPEEAPRASALQQQALARHVLSAQHLSNVQPSLQKQRMPQPQQIHASQTPARPPVLRDARTEDLRHQSATHVSHLGGPSQGPGSTQLPQTLGMAPHPAHPMHSHVQRQPAPQHGPLGRMSGHAEHLGESQQSVPHGEVGHQKMLPQRTQQSQHAHPMNLSRGTQSEQHAQYPGQSRALMQHLQHPQQLPGHMSDGHFPVFANQQQAQQHHVSAPNSYGQQPSAGLHAKLLQTQVSSHQKLPFGQVSKQQPSQSAVGEGMRQQHLPVQRQGEHSYHSQHSQQQAQQQFVAPSTYRGPRPAVSGQVSHIPSQTVGIGSSALQPGGTSNDSLSVPQGGLLEEQMLSHAQEDRDPQLAGVHGLSRRPSSNSRMIDMQSREREVAAAARGIHARDSAAYSHATNAAAYIPKASPIGSMHDAAILNARMPTPMLGRLSAMEDSYKAMAKETVEVAMKTAEARGVGATEGAPSYQRTGNSRRESTMGSGGRGSTSSHHLISVVEENVSCVNCGTRETPGWRQGVGKDERLCNACGLYLMKHKQNRPSDLWSKRRSSPGGALNKAGGAGGLPSASPSRNRSQKSRSGTPRRSPSAGPRIEKGQGPPSGKIPDQLMMQSRNGPSPFPTNLASKDVAMDSRRNSDPGHQVSNGMDQKVPFDGSSVHQNNAPVQTHSVDFSGMGASMQSHHVGPGTLPRSSGGSLPMVFEKKHSAYPAGDISASVGGPSQIPSVADLLQSGSRPSESGGISALPNIHAFRSPGEDDFKDDGACNLEGGDGYVEQLSKVSRGPPGRGLSPFYGGPLVDTASDGNGLKNGDSMRHMNVSDLVSPPDEGMAHVVDGVVDETLLDTTGGLLDNDHGPESRTVVGGDSEQEMVHSLFGIEDGTGGDLGSAPDFGF